MKFTTPSGSTVLYSVASFMILAFVAARLYYSSSADDQVTPISDTIATDSIQMANLKIDAYKFQSEYDADTWFSDFHANKVLFDKNYNDEALDIHGVIKEINSQFGCASIELEVSSSAFYSIRCSNCPQGEDKWSNEVEKVIVGQDVHIRGKYSASSSSPYTLHLYKCHIITD